MSIKSIADIINDNLNEFESPEDMEDLFCIGNFVHSNSRKCSDLMSEAATILEEYGWQNDFTLYYHKDKVQVRLYLSMAYVASCYLDGTWDDIKARIPYIIPLLLAATELRKEKNLGMIWIDRTVTKLDWSKPKSAINI